MGSDLTAPYTFRHELIGQFCDQASREQTVDRGHHAQLLPRGDKAALYEEVWTSPFEGFDRGTQGCVLPVRQQGGDDESVASTMFPA